MFKLTTLIGVLVLICLPLVAFGDISVSYVAEGNGDYDTALQVMEELLLQEPGDAFYQLRVAWLQYLRANYGEAANAYRKAIQLQDNLDAHLGLINCQLAMGKYSEALSECRIQAEQHPKNTLLLGKGGYAAYMLKDYRAAADFFARIAAIYPWDMENRAYLMNNLYLSEQDSAAREQYDFLKKYYPQSSLLATYKRVFEL